MSKSPPEPKPWATLPRPREGCQGTRTTCTAGPTRGAPPPLPRRRAGGDELLLVAVRLAALGLLDQRGGRLEALAVLPGELTRAGDEAGEAALVAVDVLQDATGPAREPDAQDRPDVRVRD